MKVSGPAALILFAANLALAAWAIYFVIKIAEHVNAWPF